MELQPVDDGPAGGAHRPILAQVALAEGRREELGRGPAQELLLALDTAALHQGLVDNKVASGSVLDEVDDVGRAVEELLEGFHPDDAGPMECGIVYRIFAGKCTGMGGGGGRAGAGPAALDHDDRLAARHAPGELGEAARVAERLEVHGDHPGGVVVLPAHEEVIARHVGPVPHRHELGEPDASGRRRPVPIEGSEFEVEVDTVVVSVGVSPNPLIPQSMKDLKVSRWGTIEVDPEKMHSSVKGVFAGGDIVRGGATVILAMGDGRKAAAAMHEYLQSS